MDYLSFVKPVDRLGERIVITVTDTADGRHETSLGKPLGVFYRNILHTTIRMVDEATVSKRFPIMNGLFQRVENEASVCRAADAPADDPARIGIDDKSNIDEATSGGDIGEV